MLPTPSLRCSSIQSVGPISAVTLAAQEMEAVDSFLQFAARRHDSNHSASRQSTKNVATMVVFGTVRSEGE